MIDLKNIKKSYFLEWNEIPIIQNVNLHIDEWEFVVIIGPSGSWKSTLMNIIWLLDRPTTGEYWLDNTNMSQITDTAQSDIRGKKIWFVFQNYSLIPRLSVLSQVMLPLGYQWISNYEKKMRATEALKKVWLEDHLHKQPEQLSGWQKQRVAIARALVTNPRLILADEPTWALDTKTSNEVIKLFQNLHKEWVTIVLITHSNEIAANAKRVIHIRDGLVTG